MGERSFTWNGGPIADDLGVLVENMGKLGQLPRDTILHIIAKADDGTSYYIPDGVRKAVFDLLTQQPDPKSSVPYDLLADFTSLTGEFTDEEKKRLFGLAEYDLRGHPDQGRIDALQQAIAGWTHAHKDDKLWYDHLGQLMGLWAQPQRDAAHSAAERDHLEHVLVGTVTAVVAGVVLAIPGVGEVLGPEAVAGVGGLVPILVAAGQEAADQHTAGNLSDQMKALYTAAITTGRAEAIVDALGSDPGLIPDSVRHQGAAGVQDYLKKLARVDVANDDIATWTVNGQRVFSGPNDPAYNKVLGLHEALEAMEGNVKDTFLEFAS
jgi:hypothetical protein